MMTIQQIKAEFESVIQYATKGRQAGNWDGLKEWNDMKDRYDGMTVEVDLCWSDSILGDEITDFRNRLLVELPEHGADGSLNEPSHFIVQCVRISTKNEFSIRRLMQIAYNIGQMNSATYDEKYLTEFAKLGLYQFEAYTQY